MRAPSTTSFCADHFIGDLPGNDEFQCGRSGFKFPQQPQGCVPREGTKARLARVWRTYQLKSSLKPEQRISVFRFKKMCSRMHRFCALAMQVGNLNCHPPKLGMMGYKKIVTFSRGSHSAQMRAKRRVTAKLTKWFLEKLASFAAGTWIEWPWGNVLHRNSSGHIKIVPRVCGFPVDGPEAKLMTCVRCVPLCVPESVFSLFQITSTWSYVSPIANTEATAEFVGSVRDAPANRASWYV